MKTTLWCILQCLQCLQILELVACVEDLEELGTAEVAARLPRHYDVDNPPFWANRGRRGTEEFGPFWANRGRRSVGPAISRAWNTRIQEPLYVEEPHWILMRRDPLHPNAEHSLAEIQPFFVSRGKKDGANWACCEECNRCLVKLHRCWPPEDCRRE